MAVNSTVDVPQTIDRAGLGSYQILIVTFCALIAMIDGFDTQAMAFVAPVVAAEMGQSIGSLGPVFGAVLLGLMVGALAVAPLADRYGRKPLIIGSLFMFGAFSLATALASNVTELIILRFMTGLGLGGAMPNIISLTSEYSPSRIRATMISTMFCGFPLGAVLGGVISAELIPIFGWRSIFVVGGLIPLIMVPFLIFLLPESVRYMATHGGDRMKISRIMRRISKNEAITASAVFVVPEKQASGFPLSHLFTEGRAPRTLLLWVTFFMNLLMLYFLASWLPSVLRTAGIPLERAIISTVLLNLGGILGALLLARIVDRMGPYRILIASYICAAALTSTLGMQGISFPVLMIVVFATGFAVIGAQITMNALAADAYPTMIRATGIGWALGIGRIGSILGPVAGGMLLSANVSTPNLFLIAAVPGLIAAGSVFILSRLNKQKPVEVVS